MESKRSKRNGVSNRQGPSVSEEQSTSVEKGGNKGKGTHESDAVPKRNRLIAKSGPSDQKGNRKTTRSSATREGRKSGQVNATDYGNQFVMCGPWQTEPLRDMDKKRKGTPSAIPESSRPGVQPIPTEDMPNGVDQPLPGLPAPNLRKPKR